MAYRLLVALAFAAIIYGPACAQDVAAGAKAFAVCRACHQVGHGAQTAVGPVLNGVVGRRAGSYPGYAYSDANKGSGIVWDEDVLEKYLASPQSVVKGTKMIFPGIKDPAKIDNVIAFLKQYNADGTMSQSMLAQKQD